MVGNPTVGLEGDSSIRFRMEGSMIKSLDERVLSLITCMCIWIDRFDTVV